MPDFGSPPTANYTPPDGLKTISSMMGLKKQQQDIQQQQLEMQGQVSQNQSLAARAQQDTQSMTERLAVQKMMQSGVDDQGNSIKKPNGDVDETKVLPALGRIAPLTGQQYAQNILKTVTDKVGLQSASAGLEGKERDMLSGIAGAQIGNPNANSQTYGAAVDNLVSQHPEMATTAGYAKSLAAHIDNIPGQQAKDQMWQHLQDLHMDPGKLAALQQQGTAQVNLPGNKLGMVTTNPRGVGGAGTIVGATTQSVAPSIVTFPNKQLGVFPGGGGAGAGGAGGAGAAAPAAPGPAGARATAPHAKPRTAADDAPPANAPGAVQDAYARSIEQAQTDIKGARDADTNYGANTHVSNVIRTLSKSTDTGPGTQAWHTMLAAIPGALSGKANDAGADYQTINAMLERQAAMARSTMGLPNTNAGQGAAEALSGTTQFAPGALQTKNNLTQALVEGSHQYRQGLEKVGGFTGQPSPTAVNNFKAAWTQNFDPNVYRAIRAHDEHDIDEQKALQRELGQAGFKALATKARNLQSLVETGSLPR